MTDPAQSPAVRASADYTNDLGFVRLEAKWIQPLLEMLETVDGRLFHPHAFCREAVEPLVESRDEYWLLLKGGTVVGYGMLRGWEEGYAIPSLGIAVADGHRGQGHGERIMNFLHDRAGKRGAKRVRLTVEAENHAARALYRKLGYRQALDDPNGPWFLDLVAESPAADRQSAETPPP